MQCGKTPLSWVEALCVLDVHIGSPRHPAAHKEPLDVLGYQSSVCLQRDPQLGSPAGRNTRYDTAHNTLQLKQKGVATL